MGTDAGSSAAGNVRVLITLTWVPVRVATVSELAARLFFTSRRRHTRCLSDWSSDVCSSDLPARLNKANRTVYPEEAQKREDKDQPTGESVKETLCIFDPEPLADEPGHHHAAGIRNDGDRDHRGHEYCHWPEPRERQHGPTHRHGEEREQGADAAACFGNAEALLGQMDHIAVEQHGYAQGFERPGRIACRESLEWKGYGVEQGSRQGHHENEEEQWESDDAEDSRPEKEEHQAHQDRDQRAPHEEIFGADVAQEKSPYSQEEYGKADPAPLSRQRC